MSHLVTVDDREYILNDGENYRLTRHHFEEAAKCANAFEMVRWAHESQASVMEMAAWGRADRGEPPLEKPKRKPEAKLF